LIFGYDLLKKQGIFESIQLITRIFLIFFSFYTERFTQLRISGARMAPDCLATSRPFLKITMVGMLLIAIFEAITCSSSVLSLANLISGSIWLATWANAGAIILQGPHHGAQ
jgi:hypothetical protein